MSENGVAENGSLENAEAIIERFGGIRPMASKMDIPVTTVQGWKKRNVIPENRREDVLHAARMNNIDLSDLMGRTANENRLNDARIEAAGPSEAPTSRPAPVMAPEPKRETPSFSQELMMNKIKAAEKSAVRKSLFGSTALLVLVAGGLTALLLWPVNEQVTQNSQAIAGLEQKIETQNAQNRTFLQGLVPDDMADKLGALRDQAQSIQERVNTLSTTLSTQADTMARGVLGADAGTLEQRLSVVEEQVRQISGGGVNVGALFDRVRALQNNVQGQAQLSKAMSELSDLLLQTKQQGGDLNETLEAVQGDDSALGQSLEGVSGDQLKAAAMLMAFTQVRSALNRQEPFGDDLALMLNMLDGNISPELMASVEALGPKAGQGVLTPGGLSKELRGLAGDIVVSSLKGEDVSVQEKAMARLHDVLQVQKDGEPVTGTDTQAAVARAQALLDQGNVEGALVELQQLQGGARQSAQPLIDNATATLVAERMQALLSESVAGQVHATTPAIAQSMSFEGLMQQMEGLSPFASKVVSSGDGSFNILPQRALNVEIPGLKAGQ